MKIKLLACLGLFVATLACGQISYSYGPGSDTQPQFPDNNNPYRTPATERPIKMPYGTLAPLSDTNTIGQRSGSSVRPTQRQQHYGNTGSRGMSAEERELWKRGILHRGRNY